MQSLSFASYTLYYHRYGVQQLHWLQYTSTYPSMFHFFKYRFNLIKFQCLSEVLLFLPWIPGTELIQFLLVLIKAPILLFKIEKKYKQAQEPLCGYCTTTKIVNSFAFHNRTAQKNIKDNSAVKMTFISTSDERLKISTDAAKHLSVDVLALDKWETSASSPIKNL